ncbi:MAG: cell division topological specificity factor MinE [Candidatus Eremiobacteraeota bacterium]|nr:cell division topological specificity factor MinE [Candidatus Eremiobacteraeota bacterium]
MLEFITRFFRREEASKNLAKERLRLVLMSDRVSLAPDIFETMKVEMLDVIRRYLEVDERALEMRFENAERQFLLLANIPVLHVKSHMPKPATLQSPSAPPNRTAPPNGSAHSPAPEQPAPAAEEAQAPSASMAIDAERSKAAPAKADAQGSAPKRRRRKRKKTSPAGASQTIAIPQPVGDPPTIPPADQ